MGNVPFSLKPCGKDYLWGGKRLNDEYKKNIDMFPLAETWECSVHPDGPSVIASGNYRGKTLKEVLESNPKLLGSKASASKNLPILVKLIDASEDLSIQVHPSDEYAAVNENGQLGKTEMWYVLDAKEDARLVYGLSFDCTKEDIKKAIEDKTISKYLNSVKVKAGDIFFIEPGTIHAIGSGIVLAEIQENSNLTYRLYDYDRSDKNGVKRTLHIDKALEVSKLNRSTDPKQPIRVLRYSKGQASEVLCRCKYFEVHRLIVNAGSDSFVEYENDLESYSVLLCIDGEGKIVCMDEAIEFKKGSCIFVPSDCEKILIHGKGEFLKVRG